HNEFYPDVDDTAMVMIALAGVRGRTRGMVGGCERARKWILAMQNRDGGWGAFDRDNDAEFLCRVPFVDHNAMIDPSTPDLTGRALEALALWEHSIQTRSVSEGHPDRKSTRLNSSHVKI